MSVQAVAMVVAGLGCLLMLVAALGVVRLPDVLVRLHASSKAGTLGAALILAAAAMVAGELRIALESALIVLFLVLTAPVASHMIGRAAYRSGQPLAADTVVVEATGDQRVADGEAVEP